MKINIYFLIRKCYALLNCKLYNAKLDENVADFQKNLIWKK